MHKPPVSVHLCFLVLYVLELVDHFVPSGLIRKAIAAVDTDIERHNTAIEALRATGAIIPMGQGKGRLYRLSAHGQALLNSYRQWYPEPDGTIVSNALEIINGPVQDDPSEV